MHNFHLLIAKWYRQNSRSLPWRQTNNPYFIWLSEIIMQQTRVEQGKAYYEKFITNYPTIIDLANAEEQQILNDWQGLGYYSRARNLHYSAKLVRDHFNGEFPNTFDEILKLKGVGSYTAAAISSFAFKEKTAVVDGNVYRLLSRVFDVETPIDSSKGQKEFQELADELIPSKNPDTHNQAIMEVGSLVCTPKNPNCNECPLIDLCLARANNTIDSRPVKSKKNKVRDRYFHFLLFDINEETYIEQRTEKGIWQNMYQFPLVEIEENEIDNHKKQWSKQWKESSEIIHKLSHQTIHATFHHITGDPELINETWIKIRMEDIQDYPLPRIIDRYLEENS
ncbi:MAG: A/G-specific adenine glycosylase [Flavobacteriales bacterium]|nr:A/G-specific adenine glycosylase [Flavobacteriales bacterium]